MRQEQEREQVQEQEQQQFKVQPSRYEYGQEQQKHRIFAVTEGVAPQTGVFYQRALNQQSTKERQRQTELNQDEKDKSDSC